MKLGISALLALGLVTVSCTTLRRTPWTSEDPLTPRSSPVKVGEMAPNFTLEDQHNQKVTLAAARGNAPTVLVFYRGYW